MRKLRPQSAPASRGHSAVCGVSSRMPSAQRQSAEQAWAEMRGRSGDPVNEEPELDERPRVHQILVQIQKHVFKRRIRIKEFFRGHDKLNCGRCTRWQFARALAHIMPSVSQDDTVAIADYFTEEGNPRQNAQIVNYAKFISVIEEVFTIPNLERRPATNVPRPGSALQCQFQRRWLPPDDEIRLQQVLSHIAMLVEKRGIRFRECFQTCDHSSNVTMVNSRFSGKITAFQFCKSFPFISEFPEADLNLLLRRYQAEDGNISFTSLDDDVTAIVNMNLAKATEPSAWPTRPPSALNARKAVSDQPRLLHRPQSAQLHHKDIPHSQPSATGQPPHQISMEGLKNARDAQRPQSAGAQRSHSTPMLPWSIGRDESREVNADQSMQQQTELHQIYDEQDEQQQVPINVSQHVDQSQVARPEYEQEKDEEQFFHQASPVVDSHIITRQRIARANRPQSAPAGRQQQLHHNRHSSALQSVEQWQIPSDQMNVWEAARIAIVKLQEVVDERRIRLHDRFVEFDHLRRGTVTSAHMKAVFTVAGIDLEPCDYEALTIHYGRESIGGDVLVCYRDICADLAGRSQSQRPRAIDDMAEDLEREQAMQSSGGVGAEQYENPSHSSEVRSVREDNHLKLQISQEVEEVEEFIRHRLRVRRFSLQTVFKDLVRGGVARTRRIPKTQFVRGMDMAGFRLKPRQLDALCWKYGDKEDPRQFNYVAFCQAMEVKTREEAIALEQFLGPHSVADRPNYFDLAGRVVPYTRPSSVSSIRRVSGTAHRRQSSRSNLRR